jgi:hypothetical protein
MPEPSDAHYNLVLKAITSGRVIPFLGAGVNLCDRPEGTAWAQQRTEYLPSGGELAEHLAGSFGYPGDDPRDLLRISQYVAVTMGSGPLYASLHDVFDDDYPPTSLHRFLATLPATLRRVGLPSHYPLIVTTNYDDLMERAFQEAEQPYDVVSYVAEGEERGKFVHWPPEGEPVVIERPNEYRGLALDERPVVLKIHGAIDRTSLDGERDSFVITEDHYIDYLTRTDLANLIPVTILAKLKRSHFLFLGYSLSDWNLRVILHRIWGEQKLSWKSWAVQLNPEPIELEFWDQRGVDIVDVRLDEYVAALHERLEALPEAGGTS